MRKFLRFFFHRVVIIALLMVLQLAAMASVLIFFEDYYFWFYAASTAASLILVVYILNGRRNPAYKLAWIIILLLVPIFGLLFYVLFGKVRLGKARRAKLQEVDIKSLSAMGSATLSAARTLVQDPVAARQSEYISGYGFTPPYGVVDTEYFPLGEDFFESLKRELKQAKNYIFMEYFIIQEGHMWNSILDILVEKVKEGVDVRLIYDDMGCIMTLPWRYDRTLEEMGIKCGVFNPFVPVLSSTFNNRSHRKTCIIDGQLAYTGGINLADEYINAYVKHGHWKDTAVLLRGEAAWGFTVQFLGFWDYIRGEERDYASYRPAYPPSLPEAGVAQPYTDSPFDDELMGETVYMNMITSAERYLYITTPYLVIDNELLFALCNAAKNGVDVRIITPHIRDKWYVHPVTRSYYEQLVECGVHVYEYTPGFMHAKSFVSDDNVAVVGTINLDYRSLYLHFECAVWMYKTKAVGQVLDDFRETLPKCQQITLDDCRNVPFSHRLARSLLRVFAPIM